MDEALYKTFPNTRWSLVSQVRRGTEREARAALAELFEKYRSPLVFALMAWAGASGRSRAEARTWAEDAVADVFAELVEKPEKLRAQRGKGNLRTYLKKCLQNSILNTQRALATQRRGGNVRHLAGEQLAGKEPLDLETPLRILDRRLAWQILGEAQESVAENLEPMDREVFRLYLAASNSHQEIADKLGLALKDVRNIIDRTRDKLRKRTRALVADIISDPAECEAELLELLGDAFPDARGRRTR